ncbi:MULTISPECIES: sulfite exporter TauE/SafE family protein [unclassified Streptomyces]|uniref:sulfite exporter TauE/SafE family protein n=1 Tax=unclassified Streptomyces TaxID=2593676 RepID=UPI0028C39369|nr:MULTISPECIES: sulfite exporter TauE/SafE family protein [unclassified Streptomyces]WNO71069.1 sulfite exporter TauE/SafE family protein [Streptomyces sp. AM8-1-1]
MDITVSWGLVALAAAAALVGFSKTAVSGANTVSLAVFAAVLPARESTGVLLPILIAGDVVAVLTYRRHAHWPTLLRLFPAVAAGVVVGTVFLFWADDQVVRTSIGAILLLMAGVTALRRRSGGDEEPSSSESRRRGRLKARSYGVLSGFTTMVANAGGPVMSLYLLSAGFRKLGFLGTSAWFFLIVNVSKVPFSVGLGLIDRTSLLLDAVLVLFVLPGAMLGKWCADRIDQVLFERLVIAATVLGGLQLLLF